MKRGSEAEGKILSQITIRDFGPDLENRLRRIAATEGISLNQAAIRLLRRGAGLQGTGGPADCVGDSLDRLAGTWSEEESQDFLGAVEACEMVDESLWQ